ncbi:MAG: RluA family pseudouridine synthase [Armatimonadota bacterium]|nr:RluA family pseudouridine synthase [Armatimonadota bacterium]
MGPRVFAIEASAAGRRLDRFLAERLPELSRARLQALIASGHAVVELPDGRRLTRVRAAHRLRAGERVRIEVPPSQPAALVPEPIPLAIVYEDAELLVIDKPAGLTVHPGAGHHTGTLVHAVLAHCPDLPGVGGEQRPGIVHRLDKDTSGLLVVAKTEAALRALQAQIRAREMRREYLALVWGRLDGEGTIDAPIGRDPRHRTRMAVNPRGRRAVTGYRAVEHFARVTLLALRLASGRTHQIRVHCAAIGHPVVGDPTYGRRPNPWGLQRQALHAARLAFRHPTGGALLAFTSPLPEDIAGALGRLRAGEPGAGRRREGLP